MSLAALRSSGGDHHELACLVQIPESPAALMWAMNSSVTRGQRDLGDVQLVPRDQLQQQVEWTVEVVQMNLENLFPGLPRPTKRVDVDSLRTSSESPALASRSASIAAIASRTIRPRSTAMPYCARRVSLACSSANSSSALT